MKAIILIALTCLSFNAFGQEDLKEVILDSKWKNLGNSLYEDCCMFDSLIYYLKAAKFPESHVKNLSYSNNLLKSHVKPLDSLPALSAQTIDSIYKIRYQNIITLSVVIESHPDVRDNFNIKRCRLKIKDYQYFLIYNRNDYNNYCATIKRIDLQIKI